MSGRDPFAQHRVATPLELLFDLTFVVAFGVTAPEFAHLLAENHVGAGLAGFAFATFAVCWGVDQLQLVLRAARQDPQRRAACLTYAAKITVAQIAWIGIIIARTSVRVTLILDPRSSIL
jgi:low temperature requirement protein LtrA